MQSYVVITPAHNEEAFIEKTIQAMLNQTVKPVKWLVVDDASEDRTAEIVSRYAQRYSFIELLRYSRPEGRNFANKVHAFDFALSHMRELAYNYLCNLDADISIQPDYFRKVLDAFEQDICLGIAGGMVSSRIGSKFISQEVALDSVAGAVQMFRRACFEQIGGYKAMPLGGIDSAAEITARMFGWKTQTLPDLQVMEYRRTGSASTGPLQARAKEGLRLYCLGYSVLFFAMRCVYRIPQRPILVGSIAGLLGFLKGRLFGYPIALPREAVRFLRTEQHGKLLQFVGIDPTHATKGTGQCQTLRKDKS